MSETATKSTRRVPFPFKEEAKAFQASFMAELKYRSDLLRIDIISPENIQAYHHGTEWQSHHSDHPDDVAGMKQFGQEFTIPLEKVRNGDLSLLESTLNEVVQGMHSSLMQNLYATVSEACDRSGNTISGSGKPPADRFVEALEKIEFGVDKDGQPSLPEFHLGSAALEALAADLKTRGEDFEKRVEDIRQRKIAAALDRERLRRSRFVKRDE